MNQLKVADLWNLTITNTSNNNYTIYLYGTASEIRDGLIVEGRTSSFSLKAKETKLFTPNNIESAQISWKNNKYKEIILRTGTAPSGNYTICVYAKKEKSNEELGSDCKNQIVEISAPVTLISPIDDAAINEKNPTFSWLSPIVVKNVKYSIKIVEISGGQSPEVAISTNTSFFELNNITTAVLVYPVYGRKFDAGKNYAWQVKAFTGMSLISESEVWRFRFEQKLINITQFTPLSDTENCTDTAYWNKVYYQQLGVAGNDYLDTLAGYIGLGSVRTGGVANTFCAWYPYDGYKKTMIGTLDDYHQTNSWDHAYLGDYDFNLNIIPDIPYKYLIGTHGTILQFLGDTIPPRPDVEGEIGLKIYNLDEDLREAAPWMSFTPDNMDLLMFSTQDGIIKQQLHSKIGVYGPWVKDDNAHIPGIHVPAHAEIHPAEQIWFRSPDNEDGTIFLVLTADYSGRFDNPLRFCSFPPTMGTPWVSYPLSGKFAIAFRKKPGEPSLNYSLEVLRGFDNVNYGASDGRDHQLLIKGSPIIRVKEVSGLLPDFLKVSFDRVCQIPDGTIEGFVLIETSVGKFGDTGGHLALAFRKETSYPTPYRVTIQSVKRLQYNSVLCPGPYPPKTNLPHPTPYDEESIKFEVSTFYKTISSDIVTIPQGSTYPINLVIEDKMGVFEDNYVHLDFKVFDNLNKNLADTSFNFIGVSGENIFGFPQKLVMQAFCLKKGIPKPGYDPVEIPVGKFEITYTVTTLSVIKDNGSISK